MPPTRKTQKATAQTRKTTIATHRVSATDKFKVEAGRKKASPLAIVLGLAGVAVVASIAMMFLMGGKEEPPPPPEWSKADAALDAGDPVLALRLYREELAKAEATDLYKGMAAEIRSRIRIAELLLARYEKADAAWKAINRDNLDALRDLKREFGELNRPWMPDLDNRIAELEAKGIKDTDAQRKLEWETFRKSLVDKHRIDTPGGFYGKAILDLKDYLPKVRRWSDRVDRAEALIAVLEGKCKELLARMEHARDRKALFAQVEGSAVEADARKLLE